MGVYGSVITCAPCAAPRPSPRVRFACRTSKPPEPSPRSRACTFTSTSSPNSTGPVRPGYATHASPSTSIRASPSTSSTIAVTVPRRRLSGIRLAGHVHERERDVDHPLQVLYRDVLVGRVDVGHAVREVDAGEPTLVEDVRVRPSAAQRERRLESGPLEPHARDPNRLVVALEPVAVVALVHVGLDLAVLEARRERDRLEHLANEVGELQRIVGAHVGEERAPLGDDVARGSAADHPN